MNKLLGYLAGCVAWVYALTFRRIVLYPHKRLEGALFAIWHEHQMGAILTNPDRNMVTIASRSKDGEIIAAALRVLGMPVARGSSSRGGAAALKQLTDWAVDGHSVAITVDGPRGPRHGVKPGICALARNTGKPIVPTAVVPARAWRARSWDRFMIVKPFSRVVQVFGDPIFVKPDDDLALLTALIESRIIALNEEGEAFLNQASR